MYSQNSLCVCALGTSLKENFSLVWIAGCCGRSYLLSEIRTDNRIKNMWKVSAFLDEIGRPFVKAWGAILWPSNKLSIIDCGERGEILESDESTSEYEGTCWQYPHQRHRGFHVIVNIVYEPANHNDYTIQIIWSLKWAGIIISTHGGITYTYECG
jgi:hypothetical protein